MYVYASLILSVGYGGLSVICHSLAVLTINPSSHLTKAFQQVRVLKLLLYKKYSAKFNAA